MLYHIQGWTCSLGVFPVSIKNEDFLSIANEPQCAIDAQEIKKDVRIYLSIFKFIIHCNLSHCS